MSQQLRRDEELYRLIIRYASMEGNKVMCACALYWFSAPNCTYIRRDAHTHTRKQKCKQNNEETPFCMNDDSFSRFECYSQLKYDGFFPLAASLEQEMFQQTRIGPSSQLSTLLKDAITAAAAKASEGGKC